MQWFWRGSRADTQSCRQASSPACASDAPPCLLRFVISFLYSFFCILTCFSTLSFFRLQLYLTVTIVISDVVVTVFIFDSYCFVVG